MISIFCETINISYGFLLSLTAEKCNFLSLPKREFASISHNDTGSYNAQYSPVIPLYRIYFMFGKIYTSSTLLKLLLKITYSGLHGPSGPSARPGPYRAGPGRAEKTGMINGPGRAGPKIRRAGPGRAGPIFSNITKIALPVPLTFQLSPQCLLSLTLQKLLCGTAASRVTSACATV
jgi:hypothetical protein